MPRRIITGNNAEGRSYFVSDEIVSDVFLWETLKIDGLGKSPDGSPTLVLPSTTPQIEPEIGASNCLYAIIEPWKVTKQRLNEGLDEEGFHRTATIDYVMLANGEVELILDEGRTTVRAGDLVVQRNTNHAWHNNADEPVGLWAVMVAVPIT